MSVLCAGAQHHKMVSCQYLSVLLVYEQYLQVSLVTAQFQGTALEWTQIVHSRGLKKHHGQAHKPFILLSIHFSCGQQGQVVWGPNHGPSVDVEQGTALAWGALSRRERDNGLICTTHEHCVLGIQTLLWPQVHLEVVSWTCTPNPLWWQYVLSWWQCLKSNLPLPFLC
jgi:hypothetical protein